MAGLLTFGEPNEKIGAKNRSSPLPVEGAIHHIFPRVDAFGVRHLLNDPLTMFLTRHQGGGAG
jgi:hypothetical protein